MLPCEKTVEEAWSNFKEALGIFFEETSRKGTVMELLEEAGFIMDEDDTGRIFQVT